MRLTVIMFILVGAMSAIPENADAIETGNKLLADCEAGIKGGQLSNPSVFCAATIIGVLDGIVFVGGQGIFCLSGGNTRTQIIEIVIEYLRKNPQQLHEYYVSSILSAMKEAFPCSHSNMGKHQKK